MAAKITVDDTEITIMTVDEKDFIQDFVGVLKKAFIFLALSQNDFEKS